MTAAPAIASSPIEHQAVEFLSRVLTDGYAEVRTFAEEGDTPAAKKRQRIADSLREFIRVEQGVIQEPHKLLRFLKRCETEHFNTYYGVSSRSQEGANAKKGDGNHCQVIKVLPVDLDFKYGELEARKRLADFIVAPSFTVESGDGIHAYWAISPIYLRAPKQYPLAQRLLARLADQFKGVADVQVSQPAAVLRLPDTLNYKYNPPRLTKFVAGTGRTYDVDTDFGDIFKDIAAEPQEKKRFQLPETQEVGDRHNTLYKLLRSDKARGRPIDVALAACRSYNAEHCKPPIPTDELDHYLRRVWKQADAPEFGQDQDDIPPDEGGKLSFTPFTDITRKRPDHLLGKRLYRGSPTLLVGEGAVGKGFILADIAARFTTGTPFVDALHSEQAFTRPSNVAIMLTEDADGIFKDRFEAAGGDSRKISDLSSTDSVAGMEIRSPVFLEEDMPELIRELKERKIDLLIIETLVEHMGNRSGKKLPNTSNELEVRNQLRRLMAVCQAADIYCIAVMHPRKGNAGKAIESPSGSRGFTNAARSVLFCYMDPPTEDEPAEDNPVRLLSTGKVNYVAQEPPTLRFKIRSFLGETPCGCVDMRECDHPARVAWFTGDALYDERSAQQVVETQQEGEKKHAPAKQKAINFLEKLIDGDGWIKIAAKELEEMAHEKGITSKSLNQAKKELGLVSKREAVAHGSVVAWGTHEAIDADLLREGQGHEF